MSFPIWRRVLSGVVLIAVLAAGGLLTSCGTAQPSTENTNADGNTTLAADANVGANSASNAGEMANQNTPTLAPSMPLDASGAQIVARVNDQPITLTEFDRAFARSTAQGVSYIDETTHRNAVLDTLIEQALIEQASAQQGLTIDQAAIDTELASYVEALGGADGWTEWLTANFYTEAEFRDSLSDSLLTNRLRDAITADLTGSVPQAHARHILVATEAEARDVLARLQAGETFESLAAAYSLDVTTKARGGDLGWFIAEELLEPGLAQLAFTLPLNGIAGPVQTRLGYHIIQTLERAEIPIAPDKLPLLAQLRFENWLNEIETQATIERYL